MKNWGGWSPSAGLALSSHFAWSQMHVPGFEVATDRTAMAEEAAVKAEEASVRALHLLQAAENYNAQAGDLRRQQEKVQEEQRALSEKVHLLPRGPRDVGLMDFSDGGWMDFSHVGWINSLPRGVYGPEGTLGVP